MFFIKKILFLFFLFLANTYHSQLISPELISTSGASFLNANSIVEFSIGEIAIETHVSSSLVTQGFHQPDLKGTDNLQELNIGVIIYPNPSSNEINISFSKEVYCNIKIFSLTGSVVLKDAVKGKKHLTYNVDHLNPSIYYLSIENKNKKNIYEITLY